MSEPLAKVSQEPFFRSLNNARLGTIIRSMGVDNWIQTGHDTLIIFKIRLKAFEALRWTLVCPTAVVLTHSAFRARLPGPEHSTKLKKIIVFSVCELRMPHLFRCRGSVRMYYHTRLIIGARQKTPVARVFHRVRLPGEPCATPA